MEKHLPFVLPLVVVAKMSSFHMTLKPSEAKKILVVTKNKKEKIVFISAFNHTTVTLKQEGGIMEFVNIGSEIFSEKKIDFQLKKNCSPRVFVELLVTDLTAAALGLVVPIGKIGINGA
jgi:hypothetical protein